MPVPIDIVTEALAATPNVASTSEQQKPKNIETPESATSYVVRKGTAAFGEGMGRNLAVGYHLKLGEPLPVAALRFFLPKDWVDTISSAVDPFQTINRELVDARGKKLGKVKDYTPDYAAEGKDIGAQVGGNAVNLLPGKDTPNSPIIGAAPGPISKNLGTVTDFTGAALSQPIMGGATLGKYVLSAAGAAEGSEVGGAVGEFLAKAGGAGEQGQKVGEVAGSLLGSIGSGYANVVRMNAIKEASKPVTDAVGNVASAARSAWAARQDQSKTLMGHFLDQYSTLRDEARGALQQRVMGQLANDIRMDPDAPDNLKEFAKAVEATGADPTKFNIAQKTATPSLAATVAQMRPKSFEESMLLAETNKSSQKEIENAARRITEGAVKPETAGVLKQLKEFRNSIILRMRGLNDEADAVAKTAPAMSAIEKDQQGQKIRELYDSQKAEAKAVKDALYEKANTLADQAGTNYNLRGVSKEAQDVLREIINKVDTQNVPESVKNIAKLFAGNPKGDAPLIQGLSPEVMAWFTQNYGNTKGVSLRDVNQALIVINKDIKNAAAGLNDATQVANLQTVKKALEGVIETQSTPEALKAYKEATAHYRDVYAPRFREGINASIDKNAKGGLKVGTEVIDDAALIPTYLSRDPKAGIVTEDRMRQFDNLFGGGLPGTKRVEEAYTQLGRSLEDAYATKVLGNGKAEKFSQDKHDAFLKEYEAALARVPEVQAKLNQNANKITGLQIEAAREQARYETIAGSKLTQALGPDNANKVISDALSDPRKMGTLISTLNEGGSREGKNTGAQSLIKEIFARAMPYKDMPGGGIEYDPQKLYDLLNSGKAPNGSVGGLQVAFRAAFGKAEGDRHLDTLRALAVLAERQQLTTPRFLRPMEAYSDDLLKSSTGQTTATWLTGIKAMLEGRISDTYFGGIAAGRFFNVKMREQLSKAQQEALFDPKVGEAVLAMASHPENKPIPKGVLERIFGQSQDAKDLIKSLVDKGMISSHVFNAARVSATVMANEDKKDPSKKQQYNKEPVYNEIMRAK